MAGYLEFTTGQVLTAAQVNDFLMEQAVMTFADDAARTTALAGVLREGLLTYNLNTGALERYDGTAWVPAAPETPGIGSNVVFAESTSTFSTTSGTQVNDTTVSAVITPSSNTAKVLVIARTRTRNNTANSACIIRLARDATGIGITNVMTSSTASADVSGTLIHLDSPGTAAPVTYTITLAADVSGTASIQSRQIVAIEVAP